MNTKRDCIHYFFETTMKHPEAERLTDTVMYTAEHLEGKEKRRQDDAKSIERALKKINLALGELDETTGPEGRHLRTELQKVKDQAATPTQKMKRERAYIYCRTIHDKPEVHSVETKRINRTGDQAEFLFNIWAFWIKEFGEEPSKYSDHPFFALAGILLSKDENIKKGKIIDGASVYRQWMRNEERCKIE